MPPKKSTPKKPSPNWGGTRQGAGRPSPFNRPTKNVWLQLPDNVIERIDAQRGVLFVEFAGALRERFCEG